MSNPIALTMALIWLSSLAFGFQQSPNIEDSVSKERMSDSRVAASVESLKQLRRQLGSLGAKHPSRIQFETRIKAEENKLQQRLSELEPRKPKEVPLEGEPPPREMRPKKPQDHVEIPSNREDSKLDQGPVSQSVFTAPGGAYPWLPSAALVDAGAFFGCDAMWGIESLRNENGEVTSGIVWWWQDCWWVRDRKEFWKSDKPILAFHPSRNFSKDKTWFVVCRDTDLRNASPLELWAYEGWPTEGQFRSQLLFRGKLKGDSDSISLSFEPMRMELVVGVNGIVEIDDKSESSILRQDDQFGLILGLQRCFTNGQLERSELRSERLGVKGRAIISSIATERSSPSTQELRPFWRKIGVAPSCVPEWWKNRSQRIIRHPYSLDKNSLENGKMLWSAIGKLKPGDTLMVAPGEYSSKARLELRIQGEAEAPIVIRGEGPGVVFTRTDGLENVININNSQFAVLDGIEVTGGSIGIRIEEAHDVMICNSDIHHVGDVAVALNTKNNSGIYIVDNEIHHTSGHGEGIYAGSHDGSRTTHSSYFVGNYIHDLASDPESQGDGIEIKDRSYGNTIKWNYVVGSKYPAITVYSAGAEDNPRNLIEENVVMNSQDSGIQVTGDAEIRSNWISGNHVGLLSKPFEKASPRNLIISGNTVLGDAVGIKGLAWNRSDIILANNFLYSKNREYFHSGFGKALYLSNQLVSQLSTDKEINQIVKKTQNRLLSSTDIFGRPRSNKASYGAVEYRDEWIDEEPSKSSADLNCDTAIWDSEESRIHLVDRKSSKTVSVDCQNHLGERLDVSDGRVLVTRIKHGFNAPSHDEFWICLFDQSAQLSYQGKLETETIGGPLKLNLQPVSSSRPMVMCINSFGQLSFVATEEKTRLIP